MAITRIVTGAPLPIAGSSPGIPEVRSRNEAGGTLVSAGVPAVPGSTSSFNNGILSVFGNSLDNTEALSRNAAGTILVNGGAVAVVGGTPTVANTALIKVFGQAGNDVITIDETNGTMPGAQIFGGTGRDVLTGGSGNDQIFGQGGNDILRGKAGIDFLFGGDDNDVLIGGDGDDQMFGEAGNDRMIWNPGDDNDLMEGGTGTDTAEVNGSNGAEVFTVTANGLRVRLDRVDPAPFTLDIGTTEALVVALNGGDDRFTAGNGLATLISLTVDGGTGQDTITGSDGADRLLGGDGNDSILGGRGNDIAFLGSGDDVFAWNPGDGSDTVEGQAGIDRLLFNGANLAEVMQVSAQGSRMLLSRDIGNVSMDLNGVETLEITALGGADRITVNDMSGTDLLRVIVNLAGTVGATTGDGAADSVTVTGSGGAEVVTLTDAGTSLSILGLRTQVTITGVEAANDLLVVNLLGGSDAFDGNGLQAGGMRLAVDAGAGDDVVVGSRGNDLLNGGAGDDRFIWRPGDGSDVVEGQDGTDTVEFFGAAIAETMTITANGDHVSLQRDIAAVTMDLHGVEALEIYALGGADRITVGDVGSTILTRVLLDLQGSPGAGDGAADTVTLDATQGADVIGVVGSAGKAQVFGTPAEAEILGVEAGLDRLVLNGQGGSDVIDASGLLAGTVQLTLNGGTGDDLIIGSQGGDLVIGGDGNDTALMGLGDDTFVWNPGDDNDTVEGQAGLDTLQFNGANIAETISIGANGSRAVFGRDIANVSMDLNGVETIRFDALGGADTIRVGDLAGTDVTDIVLHLGGADGQADTVVIQATNAADVVVVAGNAGEVLVLGLHATIHITGFEAARDRVVINGLGGDDVIDGSGLGVGGLLLTLNGGDGDDVLTGGAGNDILMGEAGDDVLVGGLGLDILDGGAGSNLLIQ